jgi:hypothetical protein
MALQSQQRCELTTKSMNEADSAAPAIPFKDRSTGLVVFGILTILAGAVCALILLLMFAGQSMAARDAGGAANNMGVLPGILMYGMLAVVLVWLGVGSIKARRWARALLLIFSWSWLIIGVMALVVVAVWMPKMMEGMATNAAAGQPQLPEATRMAAVIISLIVVGVFFVAIPAVWVFFYRSPHVKATCEARDPVRRWTDACPLPVLAICLWLGFSVVMTAIVPLTYRGVLPFFGHFLTGAAGMAGYFIVAAIWAWCAWALYRLNVRGWWVTLVGIFVMTISHVMTYSRHDITELYTLMGYPETQIAAIKNMGALSDGWMTWGMLAGMVPFVGYLLWVKKYFRKEIRGGAAA